MRQRPTAAHPARVLLCGYYGEHNLGDDALLEVLLGQLPAGCIPLVTAHDQSLVARRFGVETVDRRNLRQVLASLGRCDALVLGGGSLLQDATSRQSLIYYLLLILMARLRGRSVMLWGQGLGPLRHGSSRLLTRLVLPLVQGISWRDGDSAAQARRWRIAAEQGSDPVWAFEPRPWQGRGGPILLCWRPLRSMQPSSWRTYLLALSQLAERVDRPVLWLPFHQDQDRGLLESLCRTGVVPSSLQRRSREIEATDPQEAMDWFSSASLVIAMRLHGLILASLAGSPCAALSYDPKVAAAAAGLGCPCHPLDRPAPQDLVVQWNALVDQEPDPAPRDQLRQQTAVHRDLLQPLARVPSRLSAA